MRTALAGGAVVLAIALPYHGEVTPVVLLGIEGNMAGSILDNTNFDDVFTVSTPFAPPWPTEEWFVPSNAFPAGFDVLTSGFRSGPQAVECEATTIAPGCHVRQIAPVFAATARPKKYFGTWVRFVAGSTNNIIQLLRGDNDAVLGTISISPAGVISYYSDDFITLTKTETVSDVTTFFSVWDSVTFTENVALQLLLGSRAGVSEGSTWVYDNAWLADLPPTERNVLYPDSSKHHNPHQFKRSMVDPITGRYDNEDTVILEPNEFAPLQYRHVQDVDDPSRDEIADGWHPRYEDELPDP